VGVFTFLETKMETEVYYINEETENQKKCYKTNVIMAEIRFS
jgi:hypothetical protein